MKLEEIETFLTIVHTRSITKTAELLFLSQPTVSHRLLSLEKELNFPLVIRQKGHKRVELTGRGTEFITIAQRWMSLWKETQALHHNSERVNLLVGCTDSLNTALFAPLYTRIQNSDSNLNLCICTRQSSELYAILNTHDIDIGFVYHNLHYKNIVSEQLFAEKLYLVQSRTPFIDKPAVHTDELNPEKEIYLGWDNNFPIWHDRWFPGALRPHIIIDTITLMSRVWQSPDNWLIAPESAILELAKTREVFVSEIINTPPPRICYKIKHKYPKLTSELAVSEFEALLCEFLKKRATNIPLNRVFGKRTDSLW